jgi:hypothetical protein
LEKTTDLQLTGLLEQKNFQSDGKQQINNTRDMKGREGPGYRQEIRDDRNTKDVEDEETR